MNTLRRQGVICCPLLVNSCDNICILFMVVFGKLVCCVYCHFIHQRVALTFHCLDLFFSLVSKFTSLSLLELFEFVVCDCSVFLLCFFNQQSNLFLTEKSHILLLFKSCAQSYRVNDFIIWLHLKKFVLSLNVTQRPRYLS